MDHSIIGIRLISCFASPNLILFIEKPPTILSILAETCGDGNEDPADISRLVEKLRDNDIAVASRFMIGGHSDDSDDPLIRRLGNRFFTFLANMIWRAGAIDSTNGLRAIRRDAWNRLDMDSHLPSETFGRYGRQQIARFRST